MKDYMKVERKAGHCVSLHVKHLTPQKMKFSIKDFFSK